MRDERDTTDYDRLYDDLDSIAAAKTERAIALREVSPGGLLRMLEHEAQHEEPAYASYVVDPELIELLRDGSRCEEAVSHLRARLAAGPTKGARTRRGARAKGATDEGARLRVQYALVRMAGPEAPEVATGLASKERLLPTLRALATFDSLPSSLLPLLAPLADRDDTPSTWVDVLVRVQSSEVATVLLQALERDELRQRALAAITGGREAPALRELSDAVRARFDRAASVIEQSRRTGLPNRVELVVAAAIAGIAPADAALARRALAIFDLVPGVLPKNERDFGDSGARARVLRERLVPFVALLARSADVLDEADRERLATFMESDLSERFEAAASAWVRLPVDRARALAARWNKGTRELVDARWEAAARAYAAHPRAELAALLPDRVLPTGAQDAPVGEAPIAPSRIATMVKSARDTSELLRALTLAAEHGVTGVLPEALVKLRDPKIRMNTAIEDALVPLIDDHNESRLEDEIDGDNPFRDRREALARVRDRR